MGLIRPFSMYPHTLHHADNCLTSLVHMDMFDRDLLLALAPMTIPRSAFAAPL
jgi:hypothetical protein